MNHYEGRRGIWGRIGCDRKNASEGLQFESLSCKLPPPFESVFPVLACLGVRGAPSARRSAPQPADARRRRRRARRAPRRFSPLWTPLSALALAPYSRCSSATSSCERVSISLGEISREISREIASASGHRLEVRSTAASGQGVYAREPLAAHAAIVAEAPVTVPLESSSERGGEGGG